MAEREDSPGHTPHPASNQDLEINTVALLNDATPTDALPDALPTTGTTSVPPVTEQHPSSSASEPMDFIVPDANPAVAPALPIAAPALPIDAPALPIAAPALPIAAPALPINTPRPGFLDFRLERDRLASFSWTNFVSNADPRDLALSGFYWSGPGDKCRCAFCSLEILRWQPGDNVLEEHFRWNSACPFLQGATVGNVPLEQNSTLNLPANSPPYLVPAYMPTTADLEVLELGAPRRPEFTPTAARLASFTNWPQGLTQTPQDLAAAGFFYMGYEDRVACFFCGGGLKNWSNEDQPFVEHAVVYPTCPYLIHTKGQAFVDQVQASGSDDDLSVQLQGQLQQQVLQPEPAAAVVVVIGNHGDGIPEENAGNQAAAGAAAQAANGAPEPDIAQGGNDDEEGSFVECEVCHQRAAGIVFLPCGHLCACRDCAPQVNACPLCHERPTGHVMATIL